MERKKTSLVILGVCALVLSIIGVTYAFWQLRLSQTDNNTIGSSCFDVQLINEKNAINLGKAYPIEDEEGEQLTPFEFTIHNHCNANANYQINLELIDTLSDGTQILEQDQLNPEYVTIKFNEKNEDGYIVNLAEDLKFTNPTLEHAYESYILETGYLKPNEDKNYELRLWIPIRIKNAEYHEDAMNKTLASKITVTTSYLSEETMKPQVDLQLVTCNNNIFAQGSGTTFNKRGIASYEYQLDNNGWQTNDGFIKEFTDVGAGSHTVGLKVTDDQGAYKEITKEIEVTIEEPRYQEIAGKSIPIVTCGNGLYEVEHKDEEALKMDEQWQITEYRYAGVDYVDPSWYAYKPNNSDREYGYYNSAEECAESRYSYMNSGSCIITEHPHTEDYVHNYVKFNEEIWRIIGLVNVKMPNGEVTQRLKILKEESIGSKPFASVSSSYYIKWGDSSLLVDLNDSYYKSLNTTANDMLNQEIVWSIGSGPSTDFVKDWYVTERGKLGDATLPYEWSLSNATTEFHSIGLMNSSDYGYATGGYNRSTCLNNTKLSRYSSCSGDNWIYLDKTEWLISTIIIYPGGSASLEDGVSRTCDIRPVVYLRENVHIKDDGNDGSYEKPYELELTE